MTNKLLEIKKLSVQYRTEEETVYAVNDVDLEIGRGETLGLVGETGAGKTTTALSILRLIPSPPGVVTGGTVTFDGQSIYELSNHSIRDIRGNKIAMVFQDPMTALDPIMRVEDQIAEVIELHDKCGEHKAHERAQKMLEMVGIPAERGCEYPHQFSGGMKQRVVIAMALACSPELLIADEPTTALDVTIQAQVLKMISDLRKKIGMSMLLITHDLGIVAETCDRVAIMYAGQIVEYGSLHDIFKRARHPYTLGLFGSIPSLGKKVRRLNPIEGLMPDPSDLPQGCSFHPRCPHCHEQCRTEMPMLREVEPGHLVRCHFCDAEEVKGDG